MCDRCEHFRSFQDFVAKCDAFPRRIPEEIYFEGGDHRKPFRDEEIVFEPVDSDAKQWVQDIWGRRPRKIVTDDGGAI